MTFATERAVSTASILHLQPSLVAQASAQATACASTTVAIADRLSAQLSRLPDPMHTYTRQRELRAGRPQQRSTATDLGEIITV